MEGHEGTLAFLSFEFASMNACAFIFSLHEMHIPLSYHLYVGFSSVSRTTALLQCHKRHSQRSLNQAAITRRTRKRKALLLQVLMLTLQTLQVLRMWQLKSHRCPEKPPSLIRSVC